MGGPVMTISYLIEQYVGYRRSLGEKFKTNASVLRHFCRYVGGDTEIQNLTEADVTAYLYSGHEQVTAHWFCKYGALKGFLTWAVSRGYTDRWILTDTIPNRPEHIVPYIYSNQELKKIFDTALVYQKNRSNIYPECVRTLLMLTYFLGLRIHETMSLKLRDIDLNERHVFIRESKFYKSRIVTFNEDVLKVIQSHLSWRIKNGMSESPETGLWLDRKNNPMKRDTIDDIFARIRIKAGIKREDGAIYQPRLHDLRHTFAVNRLRQWYENGEDVQHLLPALSTYMGHKHLSHTSVYLTMTDNILKLTSDIFQNFSGMKGGGS